MSPPARGARIEIRTDIVGLPMIRGRPPARGARIEIIEIDSDDPTIVVAPRTGGAD